MNTLETVGAITLIFVGLVLAYALLVILREARRSFRQTCKVSRVVNGRRSHVSWKYAKWFVKDWAREYGDKYTQMTIRYIVLHHNPSVPFGRVRFENR